MGANHPYPSLSHSGRLDALEIHRRLRTRRLARTIFIFPVVGSTNQAAMKMAKFRGASDGGIPEGTLFLAETQTQGRGRLGRRWVSPPGVNVYASFALCPRISAPDSPLIGLLAAVSVVGAIRRVTGLKASVKWPNDILFNDRKLAGILTELHLSGREVKHLIIGIGINANVDPAGFPPSIRRTATSLLRASGRAVDRNELVALLSREIERRYDRWLNEGPSPVLDEYRALCSTLGRQVRVETPSSQSRGTAVDIDRQGALILKIEAGRKKTIQTGDITHLRHRGG